ncbi:MAG: ABC transporter ATP-binding protein [Acidimicrobiales bacterium]|jgi:oligopeptide/dipeptide ABC transporter ATP-binding protein
MPALAADGTPLTPVLEVENLHTEFHLRTANVRAVDGVSFHVNPGECVGLVGESACGKTTVGLSIMKLLPNVGHVTGGSIRLFGRDLAPYDESQMCDVRGNEIGMIFQDPMTSLNPTWKIGRQIAEVVRLHRKVSRAEAYERALEVLTLVGMPRPAERLDTYPHQLSGGLRQRVMIAIALACEPKLLIADEPTTALDVTIQAQILNLIDELRERLKMAVILITHDLGVIAARSDRVMVMYAGKIVESATAEELFGSMRHPYAEALLESIPRLDQDRNRRLFTISGLPPDLSGDLVGCRFAPRCRYATDECRSTEPELLPGPASLPGAATGPSSDATDVATSEAHLYACFHPVTATREERLARRGIMPEHGARTAAAARKSEAEAPVFMSEDALEVTNLVKDYPVVAGVVIQRKMGTVQAVSDVSFTVRRGETFGLVGESGCGKTTIGRLVVALERPTKGGVRYESLNVTKLRGRALRRGRRDLQMIFQDPYSSLDPRMRVKTIVREPLVVQKIGNRRSQFQRVVQLLGEVGLTAGAAELYPHEFSGGQRQRIGLARALALNPKLIVADEPVSALDVSIQAQILNLMRDLQQRHDLTYVVISHDLAVVKYLADRIGVMYLGKLVETGPAIDIYERTAHPYTQALIDAIPVPDPVLARETRHEIVRGELPSAMAPPSGCRFRTRCPFAQEVCAAEEPPLRPVGSDHLVACHFPLQTPIGDELASASAAGVTG